MRRDTGIVLHHTAARDRDIRGFKDILEVTDDFREALTNVGRSYASMRRTLLGAGEHELAERMKVWHDRDGERLRYALGRQWQGAKAS